MTLTHIIGYKLIHSEFKIFYVFLKDISLIEQTISQSKLLTLFLRNFYRHKYQLLWLERDQAAYIAFPQHFTRDEYFTFIIDAQNENPLLFNPETL